MYQQDVDILTLQEVSLELMLLGCTPDAASDTSSGVNSSTPEDSSLRARAVGCELLCYMARGANLPLLKRCVNDLRFPL